MNCSRSGRLHLSWIALAGAITCKPQSPFDVDPTFVTQIDELFVSSIAVLSDDDLLLSGAIKFPGDLVERSLARVNANGSQDAAFPYSYGGGRLTEWNGTYYVGNGPGVRRVWPDGTLDNGFDMVGSPYFSPLQGGDYHVFPDGRVLLSGYHQLSDSIRGFEGMYSLIWFGNEGYLDTTRIHRWSDGSISDIEELPDGKFVCSGYISQYEAQPCSRMIRVHPDGSLDANFQPPNSTWGKARDFLPLPDGRVIAVGEFLFPGFTDTLNIIRLLPDGELDTTFNNHLQPWRSFDPGETDFIIGIDSIDASRYVITGRFNRMDGEVRGGIALIDSAGNLSIDDFSGGGCGAYFSALSGDTVLGVAGITEAPDGSYFVFGSYYGYDDGTTNDALQRMVSKLHGLDVTTSEPQPTPNPRFHYDPATATLTFSYTSNPKPQYLELFDPLSRRILVRQVAPSGTIHLKTLASGTYIARLTGPAISSVHRFVVP